MRTLATLAVLTAALAAPVSGKAPVPKDSPPPSIDGKYTLVNVSLPEDRAAMNGPGAVIGGAGPGGGVLRVRTSTASLYMTGPAVITKDTITLEGRGTVSPFATTGTGASEFEYTLDASKSPMTIDLSPVSARGKKGKPQLGLAEVVGNRLIVAVAPAGEDRPKNTEENDNVTVYYFQKAPPPPKTEFRIVAMTVGKEADAEKELNQLAKEGYELVSTSAAAPDAKSSPTTVHFVLKRVTK
jgi:hypothetical protein